MFYIKNNVLISVFQPILTRGTSGTLMILWRNLAIQKSTIYSILREPSKIGGTSGFRGTRVEKHWSRLQQTVSRIESLF